MKIDLDEIERKARALLAERAKTRDVTDESAEAAWQYGEATPPPVTLALIARIRELEAVATEVRNELLDGCLGQQEIDAILEKGAVIP